LPANGIGLLKPVQDSDPVSNPGMPAAVTYDISPLTKKVVYLSLLAGVFFLGTVASYVWYGFYQWQNIP
jgi:hypothetical protein